MCAEYNEPLNRKGDISTTVNHANQLLKEIEQVIENTDIIKSVNNFLDE